MKKLWCLIGGFVLLSVSSNSYADESEQTQFIQQFNSAKKSKILILESFDSLQQCGVGSCDNAYRTDICEQVAAVDIQTGYQITGDVGGADVKFKLHSSDLALFKDLYASCKPTSYQYWNFDSLFHVVYNSDAEKAVDNLKKSLK